MSNAEERMTERLKTALLSLNKEQRIEEISIRELTQKAGISRSTFYAYFDDIYSLREKIEDDILDRLQQGMIRPKPTDGYLNLTPENNRIWFENFKACGEELLVLCGPNGDYTFHHRLVALRESMIRDWMFYTEPPAGAREKTKMLRLVPTYAAEGEISQMIASLEQKENTSTLNVEEICEFELLVRDSILNAISDKKTKNPEQQYGKIVGTSVISEEEIRQRLSDGEDSRFAKQLGLNGPIPETCNALMLLPFMLTWAAKKAVCRCLNCKEDFDSIDLLFLDNKRIQVLLSGELKAMAERKKVLSVDVTATIEASYVVAYAEAQVKMNEE